MGQKESNVQISKACMFQTEQEQKITPDENLAFSKFPVLKTQKKNITSSLSLFEGLMCNFTTNLLASKEIE